MKGEESPDASKLNMERDLKILQQISRTPKGKKIGLDDLHLLGLHRDCSPNAYGSSQDKLEIGWGDSPEPLKIEQKAKLHTTPIACKKRLEAKESPKSRCRSVRPSIRLSSTKTPVDVSKYIAEVQALSKKIMTEIDKDKTNTPSPKGKENNFRLDKCSGGDFFDLFTGDDVTNEYLIACSQSLESKLAGGKVNSQPNQRKSFGGADSSRKGSDKPQIDVINNDSAFEKVLQSFITEEDDWLSQVALNVESTTPRKNGFVKTKSENELTSPDSRCKFDLPISRRSNGLSCSYRRTYSSDRVTTNIYKSSPSCSTNADPTGKNRYVSNQSRDRKLSDDSVVVATDLSANEHRELLHSLQDGGL